MIPYKPNRLYEMPKTPAARLEIVKAIRALAMQDGLQKFDPNQPRIPAGNQAGGQWTTGEVDDAQSIIATARQLRFAATPDIYQKCLDLCYPLLERFQPPGSDRNTWDFHKCLNACLGRSL